MPRLSLLLALVPVLACYAEAPDRPAAFSDDVATLRFEIDAMVGAEPLGASATVNSPPWELLRVNVEALYERAPRKIALPEDADGIGILADPGAGDYDADALLDLAAAHRDTPASSGDLVFHVLFVDGYYLDDGVRQDAVLGVSLGDSGTIAMFAPVIGDGPLSRFVEQTTLVHELGHAFGLVDNGVEMVDDHLDVAHGHHCENPDCVMYWLNEGAADLRTYAQQYASSGEVVLFDDACLADAAAAATG
jgi:hypothetical protein